MHSLCRCSSGIYSSRLFGCVINIEFSFNLFFMSFLFASQWEDDIFSSSGFSSCSNILLLFVRAINSLMAYAFNQITIRGGRFLLVGS